MKELNALNAGQLATASEKAFWKVSEKMADLIGDRTGGVMQVFYATDHTKGLKGWKRIWKRRLGRLTPELWEEKRLISNYKANTLMIMHMIDNSAVSSWQYRQEHTQDFGGAFIIIADIPELGGEIKLLFSFSGFPEECDEAVGLLTAKEMLWGDEGQWETITDHSGNTRTSELLAA